MLHTMLLRILSPCVDKAAWQRKKDIGNEEVQYVTVYQVLQNYAKV